MNLDTHKKIIQTAYRVRRWAEEYADAVGYVELDLCGLCAITSIVLMKELRQQRIRHVRFVYINDDGNGHVYLEVGKKQASRVLDVTATQFKMCEPVIFERYQDLKKRKKLPWYWGGKKGTVKRFASIRLLTEKMDRDKWPSEQQYDEREHTP